MDFDILNNALNSANDQKSFDEWLAENFNSVSMFFYNLPAIEIENQFDTFYFGTFLNSLVFADFHRHSNRRTEAFDGFLTILAVAAERLAESGFSAPLDNLIQILPTNSVKYRLRALVKLNSINNAFTDYIDFFLPIMELLNQANKAEEDVSEFHLVDMLIWYYKKAQKNLSRLKADNQLIHLRQLFAADQTLEDYPFAAHPKLQRLIHGESEAEKPLVDTGPIETVEPSRIIENLFSVKVNGIIFRHPETNFQLNKLMGYRKDELIGNALLRGRADFRSGYKSLSAEEKVLLYCYFNMKKHYCTSVGVYRKIWSFWDKILSDNIFLPIFIDIGCGPLTSGLALADQYYAVYGASIKFHYVGVDIAPAMIEKAKEFFISELFAGSPEPKFYRDWNDISFEYLRSISGRNHPVIVNASYFFSSEFLKPLDFANFISKLVTSYEEVYFIFQNPQTAERNKKYYIFKKQFDFQEIDSKNDTIKYKTKFYSDVKEEELLYEILKIHKPSHAI